MRRFAVVALAVLCSLAMTGAGSAQHALEEELRAELVKMKAQMARIEVLVERLEKDREAQAALPTAQAAAPQRRRASALNTPPMLPVSQPEAFRKTPPRFDFLIQMRGQYFADRTKNDTFLIRKAELGVKGHVAPNVDFSLELDPVRFDDPYRRTYIRLTQLPWLHMKLGLEKAPIGLDELTPTGQIPFADRSEVNDRFAAAEELGMHLESHWDHWLFQLAVTNGGRRLLRDNNKRNDVTARVVWGPRRWLSLGAATLQGRVGGDRRERDRYNAELKLGSNFTGFQSEFYRAKDAQLWSSAYYLAGYWAIRTRASWLTHFQPVLRYEQIGRSDHDRQEELRLLTPGFSLLFHEHRSKLQLNYLKDLHTRAHKDEVRLQYQVEF